MGLKLLVDVCPLLKPRTGVGNYIFYLLRELLHHEQVDDIVGLCGLRFFTRAELQQLVATPTGVEATIATSGLGQQVRHYLKMVAKNMPYGRELRTTVQAIRLKLRWKQFQDYIFWGGNYDVAHFPGKSVVTLHDLSHVHYPQFHPADRVHFLTKHLFNTLQRVNAITVVSEATRQDVLQTFATQITLPAITVISPAAALACEAPAENELVRVKQRYQLPEQFILSVGTLEPRKNVERLLNAYMDLPANVQAQYPLLLVGSQGWLTQELVQRLNALSTIRWLGYIADEDMPTLYRCASVFVYVSLFEGFGMPVLEAMTCGVPVLTSNVSSLPEVAGNAALLVDPTNVPAIKQGLLTLLQDEGLRQRLAALGLTRSTAYNWAVSANQLIDVFIHLNANR